MESTTINQMVLRDQKTPNKQEEANEWKLHRWQVSFRSGTSWYAVGEFLAVDAAGAIERAIAVFGPCEEHKAEEIPWDAAPLPRVNSPAMHLLR